MVAAPRRSMLRNIRDKFHYSKSGLFLYSESYDLIPAELGNVSETQGKLTQRERKIRESQTVQEFQMGTETPARLKALLTNTSLPAFRKKPGKPSGQVVWAFF